MHSTRRDFLKTSLGSATLLALGPTVPAFLGRAARAADARRGAGDTVLVVLQLSGGNDGLNTVVPYADDAYGRGRRTLRLSAAEVHKIDGQLGFHPAMKGFSRLLKQGRLSVVQGVAYPNPNRDHPTAMHDWHTGRPGVTHCQTGWLGRAIDAVVGDGTSAVPGVFVGEIPRPFGLNARQAVVPSVRSLDPWRPDDAPEAERRNDARRRAAAMAEVPRPTAENPLLDFVSRSALDAYASAAKIEAVARATAGAADYPRFQLARELQIVAQLVRAGVGIRMFYTELGGGGIGGFDNHANQRDNHAALLREISESVTAFVDDLARDKTLDRVLLVTFSEFGRTVVENGRRGTDHGVAQPIFLAGGRLKGGLVGEHPSLTDLDDNAQKAHTDFRRIYATLLGNWLGFDDRALLCGAFQPLDLLQA
jgi:uncharacterized protein (DUF1501 family)